MKSSVLELDCAAEAERIGRWMLDTVARGLKRRGVVLGLSGGVDSSVCAALAVKALGARKVLGLLMPEYESSNNSVERGLEVAKALGIEARIVPIGDTLKTLGCYQDRDDAIRRLFPDYGAGWKCKIAIAGGLEGGLNYFRLVVQNPAGVLEEKRLPIREYLQIVAASNHKQRVRKAIEYYHADRLNFAVVGTPNLLEYDQGFFVKNGDGAADLKPIAHLYKRQVYALARHLGLPRAVIEAQPTTDTYSLHQGQDEFYFALPYEKMDLALWAHNHSVPEAELAELLGVTLENVRHIYSDIEAKRRATRYLHQPPVLAGEILGLGR